MRATAFERVVIDASLTLQWFFEDELDRGYSLAILQQLAECTAVVPILWFYEVGNGLVMACRRKRITFDQAKEYLAKLSKLRVVADGGDAHMILNLPELALKYDLTNYDTAYLELAIRRKVALATTDQALRRAAVQHAVDLVKAG